MKKINMILVASLMGLGAVVTAATFTDINSPQYYGKINIPKAYSALDANFAAMESVDGVAVGATVSASEPFGIVNKTVLTMADTPVSVIYTGGDTNAIGSTKIYDFPEGRILVLGVIVDSFAITSFPTNTMDDADGGDFAFGTAVPGADGLLDGTAVDFIPSTSIDPITNVVSSALAASAQFDGTTTAKDLYINLSIDNADLADAGTNAVTAEATMTIHWVNLGDY